jgi:hypothetical protein
MRRCEAVTIKGTRCRHDATMYLRHDDGAEYLVCAAHFKAGFRPCKSVDTDERTYVRGFLWLQRVFT